VSLVVSRINPNRILILVTVFDFAREVLTFIPANELAMKEMVGGDEYEEKKEVFLK